MGDKTYTDSVVIGYDERKDDEVVYRRMTLHRTGQESRRYDNKLNITITSRTFRGLNMGWEYGGNFKIVEDLGEGYVLDLVLEKPDSYLWSKIMPVLRDLGWGCYISEHTANCIKQEKIGNPTWGLYYLSRICDSLTSLNGAEDALCPIDNRLLKHHCSCKKFVCEKHNEHCKHCDAVMCKSHTYSCEKCSGIYCTQHIANCDLCEVLYCINDLEICCNCSAIMCRRCYKTISSGLLNREQFRYCKKCISDPKNSLQKRQVPSKEETIINRRAQQLAVTTVVDDTPPPQFASIILRKATDDYIQRYGSYVNDAFEIAWETNRETYLVKLKPNFYSCSNYHTLVEHVPSTGNLMCPICNKFLSVIPVERENQAITADIKIRDSDGEKIMENEGRSEERDIIQRFAELGIDSVVDTYFWTCCDFVENYAKRNDCYDASVERDLTNIRQLGYFGAMDLAKSNLRTLIGRILKQ
jgi:hypothetical protein